MADGWGNSSFADSSFNSTGHNNSLTSNVHLLAGGTSANLPTKQQVNIPAMLEISKLPVECPVGEIRSIFGRYGKITRIVMDYRMWRRPNLAYLIDVLINPLTNPILFLMTRFRDWWESCILLVRLRPRQIRIKHWECDSSWTWQKEDGKRSNSSSKMCQHSSCRWWGERYLVNERKT